MSSRLLLVAAGLVALAGCDGPQALDAWPARLEIVEGNFQTGLTGYPVNLPPAVRLLDSDGDPIAGARITFSAAGGGVAGTDAVTGGDGIAAVGGWTVAAGQNRLTASIPAPFRVDPVVFSATGATAAYQIDLAYLTAVPAARRATFDSAAARWQRLVFGDLQDITVELPIPPGACLGNEPAISGTIDDLLIFVTLDSIDGPGAILGAAGPCFIRTRDTLPVIGVMLFDTADVASLEGVGLFDEVILHEMGHVLGFGSLWALRRLLSDGGGSDPHFVGPQGRRAFDRVGGAGYTGGQKVPVENSGGPGTRDVHWRESVFGHELMTGFLDGGVLNPLSLVSVAAMGDQRYLVNYAAADGFTLALAPPAGAPPVGGVRLALGDDVLRLPVYTVDGTGRVTGVYRR
ncbi:MAG TPA: leishmanolysin-related zinc metalloendopeptidase [Gemmatimonadales bacterium]|nr:leishmanolysin-related zinc metalloendopeptidase [Gemmatimonadales bacterium]